MGIGITGNSFVYVEVVPSLVVCFKNGNMILNLFVFFLQLSLYLIDLRTRECNSVKVDVQRSARIIETLLKS